jgi:protein-disulfide isomerase
MLRLFRPLAAVTLCVLAACAAQPSARPTLAPDPTLAPTLAPPSAASATPPPTVAAATDLPAIAATAAPAEAGTIPIGKTPEGYNYLGSPNAPVTITFYSDFL